MHVNKKENINVWCFWHWYVATVFLIVILLGVNGPLDVYLCVFHRWKLSCKNSFEPQLVFQMTRQCVVSNLYDILSSAKYRRRYFEGCLNCFSPYIGKSAVLKTINKKWDLKKNSYRFWMRWGWINDDRIIISVWTIPSIQFNTGVRYWGCLVGGKTHTIIIHVLGKTRRNILSSEYLICKRCSVFFLVLPSLNNE